MVTMVQTVSLDENEHSVTMLRSLKEMRNDQDLCDFTIVVGTDEYPTHKNILSAGSPYFKAMLKHDTKESQEGKVEMKDVDSECLKNCIDFIYSGKFAIPDGKIGQLLHVAIMLQLDKVEEAISDVLNKSLKAGNFYETRDLAEVYNLRLVSEKCKIYYKENLMAISSQPDFENDGIPKLIEVFRSQNIELSEEEKLTASLRWVGKYSERKTGLLELIKLIKLGNVPSEYLSDLLDKHPIIGNDLHLYKLINGPLIKNIQKSNREKTSNQTNLIALFDDDDCWLRSYDPVTQKVTRFHNEELNNNEMSFSAVAMDSFIYMLYPDKSVYRLSYRDENSKWEQMRDMICDHGCYPPVVSHSGSLFVIGNSEQSTNAMEIFEPDANRWLRLRDGPEQMVRGTLVSLNDSIFSIGGFYIESDENGRASNSFLKFSPSTSEWSFLEPMEKARYSSAAAAAVKDKIFVLGGLGHQHEHVSDVECYDVVSEHWTLLSPMIMPCGVGHAHHINGSIFVVGAYLNEMTKYDIKNDEWFRTESDECENLRTYDSVLVEF